MAGAPSHGTPETLVAHERPAPLVLFDGVCNLCDATVQWVIRHDQRRVFRFAPLQSEVARRALAAPGNAAGADSIVLIDEDGRHFESAAVIRIATRLGFPWSLLAIGRALPRGVRDGVYRWVATHRYGWFGRQNACIVPLQAVRDRFVDFDVPIGSAEASALASERSLPAGMLAATAAFLHRLVLTYLVVYIFPFPLGYLPGTGRLSDGYSQVEQRAVVALAKAVLGLHLTVMPNGSGDTTYNYVEVGVFAALALLIALVWTVVARGKPVTSRTVDAIRTYVRYSLAVTLFGYGWSKVIPVQMPAPGPDRLLNTLGSTSPMGLVWTLMGTSAAYQIFAGLGEVASGVLLFWRRTALAGALVATAVLTNVVMLNYCFDVPVKLFSSHLLMMAVFLSIPHAVRLAAVLFFNLPAQPVVLKPFPIGRPLLRRAALLAKVALFVLWGIMPVFDSIKSARQYGFLVKRTPLHGTYAVDTFVRDGVAGRANEDSVRWVRFAVNDIGVGAIQRASGATRRFQLKIDPTARTFTVTFRGDPDTCRLHYDERGNGVVDVDGTFQGGVVQARLQKLPDDASLLTSRGFHWINEYPLNR